MVNLCASNNGFVWKCGMEKSKLSCSSAEFPLRVPLRAVRLSPAAQSGAAAKSSRLDVAGSAPASAVYSRCRQRGNAPTSCGSANAAPHRASRHGNLDCQRRFTIDTRSQICAGCCSHSNTVSYVSGCDSCTADRHLRMDSTLPAA